LKGILAYTVKCILFHQHDLISERSSNGLQGRQEEISFFKKPLGTMLLGGKNNVNPCDRIFLLLIE
jgi:hypothetical protein